ncbi:MAG: antiterminator LoaP [Treponemataceae bacterium]|nr:MAG: antiterminator LoaP [Treponemataceae bacterium]
MNYYALQVKTNAEEVFIEQAAKVMQNDTRDDTEGNSFFFPKRKLRVRRLGRRVEEIRPVFPGYIFLRAKGINPRLYRVLKRTPGFFRFLRSNHDITPLTGLDLDILKKFLSFGPVAEVSKVYFDENDKIVVTEDGPLHGLEGSIIKVNKRKQRVKVRVDFSYQSFVFDLAFEVITKAPAD